MLVLDDTVVFLHQSEVCLLVFAVFPATPFSIELKLLLLATSRHTLGWGTCTGSGLHEYYNNLTKQPRCYNKPVNGELSSFDGLRIAMLAVLRGIRAFHSYRWSRWNECHFKPGSMVPKSPTRYICQRCNYLERERSPWLVWSSSDCGGRISGSLVETTNSA